MTQTWLSDVFVKLAVVVVMCGGWCGGTSFTTGTTADQLFAHPHTLVAVVVFSCSTALLDLQPQAAAVDLFTLSRNSGHFLFSSDVLTDHQINVFIWTGRLGLLTNLMKRRQLLHQTTAFTFFNCSTTVSQEEQACSL